MGHVSSVVLSVVGIVGVIVVDETDGFEVGDSFEHQCFDEELYNAHTDPVRLSDTSKPVVQYTGHFSLAML